MKNLITLSVAVIVLFVGILPSQAGITLGGNTTGFVVEDFESLPVPTLPGTAYSTMTSPTGLVFGEKLAGQNISEILPQHGVTGPMEIIGGTPTVTLQMDASVSVNSGVAVYKRTWSDPHSNVIGGIGPNGGTSSGIGEGGLTVLYPLDQTVIGFDLTNADADRVDVQFFDRLGNLLDDLTLTGPWGGYKDYHSFTFTSTGQGIAAITIDRVGRNTGGGLFDNFHYNPVPEPGAGLLAAVGILAGLAWRRKR